MATKDFILKQGEPTPEDVHRLLQALFPPDEIENLTNRGARVRIIVTSPWPKPPKLKKPKIVVDENLVALLKSMAPDESALEREVANLTGPQILLLGQIIGIPLAKKTKLASLRAQLINSLRSEIVWRGISGSQIP